ncbi:MAG: GNAT family N-acetyltransferase [Thermotogota bacterium]|nr:GNAT family N-acetyltransferase [Thermotogota bacterium]
MYRATNKDIKDIMDFVSLEPEFNIFTIGDLESFGLDNDKCQFFLHVPSKEIKAIILLYHTYLTLYFRDFSLDLKPVIKKLNVLIKNGATVLSGKKNVIEAVQGPLTAQIKSSADNYFAKCDALIPMKNLPMEKVQFATEKDAHEIVGLFDRVPEFQGHNSVQEYAETLKDGSRKTTILKIDDQIISTASSTAETKDSAMIIGVATEPNPRFRKKGYASACVSKLVKDLNNRGKSACLFYDNPAAGSIYKKIGFKDMGFWKMLRFK